ncbi:unnamed protein product [Heterobilharzia americana]|nr:unnamed protein product [Heterobilharzia americana]
MLIEEINSTNESDNLDNQLSGYPMVNSLMSNKESKHMLTKLSDSELLYPRRISLKNNSSTDNAFLPYMQSNRSSNRFTLHSTLLHENHPSQDVNIDGYDNSGTSPKLINHQSRVPWFSDDEDVSTLNEHSLMTTSNHLRSKVSLDIQTKVFTSSSTDQNIISSNLTKVSSQFDENRFSTSYLLSKQWIETDTVPYINPPQSLWFPSAKHRKIIWIHDTNCGIILTWNVFTLNYCIYLICVYFKWLTGIHC